MRAIRACDYCRSRKSRCNGIGPCDACTQRGNPCSLTQRRDIYQQEGDSGHESASSSFSTEAHDTRAVCLSARTVERSSTIEKSPTEGLPYIEAYFDKFHPSWPFLHKATFDPTQEPSILLQSVLMMGLWVAGDDKMQQAAVELHEKLSLSMYQQRVRGCVFDLYIILAC